MDPPHWGYPNGVPQWVLLTCIPHFTSKQPIFTVFGACFVSKVANSLLLSAATLILSLPATGLFWARLSALDTPTNVFSTPLWSF